MISRFRVHRDLEFRKSKTGKVSTFDSRSWEPRTHPRTPLSHQNKPEQHARLLGWARARHHREARALNCQKRIIKKDWACAQRCQILLRQIILINFSLDLNLGAWASLCSFSSDYCPPSWIFCPLGISGRSCRSPRIPWTGERYGLQGGQRWTMFHITRF